MGELLTPEVRFRQLTLRAAWKKFDATTAYACRMKGIPFVPERFEKQQEHWFHLLNTIYEEH